MFWLIPLIGGSLTAAVAWLVIVSGDVKRGGRLAAVVLTLLTGAVASGAMWVVLGQRTDPSGAWSPLRVNNAFGGMTVAVFSGLVALFLPIVLKRRGGAVSVAFSLILSIVLLMFGFLSWFGAVSW